MNWVLPLGSFLTVYFGLFTEVTLSRILILYTTKLGKGNIDLIITVRQRRTFLRFPTLSCSSIVM